jgi:hypothetical protein
MLFSNNTAIIGTKETYLENEWNFKLAKMRTKVRKALEFKKQLGQKISQNDDEEEDDGDNILIIAGSRVQTPDVIRYRTDSRGFGGPYDSGKQHGDGWVPKPSAIASVSGIHLYKNSKLIPGGMHSSLADHLATIRILKRFFNSQIE